MNCEICECAEAHDFHHFIPRTLHGNKWFKKTFTQEQMKEGLIVCPECHLAVHEMVQDEKQLGRLYNTKEKLLEHPAVSRYAAWRRKQSKG
ncbi:MAG: hypothetical protein NTX50_20970 [Candidatus Sumerlaeota bacterium]|nr:hypothetical protein [Candidatus Sumerlaeota bacterium]